VEGGSARAALEESTPTELGTESVKNLWILLIICSTTITFIRCTIFIICRRFIVAKGRGTVVTGKVDQGKVTTMMS